MTPKKPPSSLAWLISLEDKTKPVRARRVGDYDKAVAAARAMSREWRSPVLMESRTHTLRITVDGEIEQLQPPPAGAA